MADGHGSGPAHVREKPAGGEAPLLLHPRWTGELPWLVQGVSSRGDDDDPFDLGLFGTGPVGRALERWGALRRATGFPRAVHARQVHGARLLAHGEGPPGLLVSEGYDGHWTDAPGVLLTVSVADCVPIFLVDPERRAVAALHAGWRGVAAGMLEAGVRALAAGVGSRPGDLWAHFGPAICGACYEVGPEVHEALGLDVPAAPTPVDLRAELARRARKLAIPVEGTTLSEHCTRCTASGLFSHRGGDAARQMGFIGIRPDA